MGIRQLWHAHMQVISDGVRLIQRRLLARSWSGVAEECTDKGHAMGDSTTKIV